LDGFTKTHFICKDSIVLQNVLISQPVNTFKLIIKELTVEVVGVFVPFLWLYVIIWLLLVLAAKVYSVIKVSDEFIFKFGDKELVLPRCELILEVFPFDEEFIVVEKRFRSSVHVGKFFVYLAYILFSSSYGFLTC